MLLLIPIGLFLTYVLPILLFVRVRALTRRLDETHARLDRIERALAAAQPPARPLETPRPAPQPGAPIVGPAPPAATHTPPVATHDDARVASHAELRGRAALHPATATSYGPTPTIESEIGGRWMLVVGTLVLVMGIAFFVKYSFDRHWITEGARVAIGTIAGI